MTIALAILLALAVLAAAGLAVVLASSRRRATNELERERAIADQSARMLLPLQDQLTKAEERAQAAENSLEAQRRRAEVAERRGEEAERKLEGLERRAQSAERRSVEAERRATAVAPPAQQPGTASPAGSTVPASPSPPAGSSTGGITAGIRTPAAPTGRSPASAVWELERVRAEREWADVVGPGEGLPVEWDGTLEAAVGVELAIIREVLGTPSELETPAPVPVGEPLEGAVAVRLCAEMLRLLGRSADEMDVKVTRGALVVGQPGDSPAPDLSRLDEAVRAAGASISVTPTGDRLVVALRLPGA